VNRRAALRVLGLGGMASLAAACQLSLPAAPPTVEPTPPTPIPTPTTAPTEISSNPGIRVAIDQDPDTLDPAGQTNPTTASIV
jgi:ABC-type transport system substrate-binding protein